MSTVSRDTILLFVLFSLLYGATASPDFLGGDAGLFATLFADGGTAHPPGYPLYAMYLRALSWLPSASPAHGASLATALLGAGSVALLYRAGRSWRLSRWASAFASIAFGSASHVWLFHTQPEVFALNHLVAAAILWMAGPDAPWTGRGRVLALGGLAGLGLSNHHTIVLLAPVGLFGVARALDEAERPIPTLAWGAAALTTGLLPYAYLPWVARTGAGWHWGEADTLGGVLHLFLRRDYGTLSLTAGASTYRPVEQLVFLAREIPADMLYLPVLAALVGIGRALAGTWRDDDPTEGAIWIVASLLLCGPGMAVLLTREPTGLDYLLVRRFHLLPQLLVALLSGWGVAALGDRISRPSLRGLLLATLLGLGSLAGWPTLQLHHAPTTEQYVRDTFESLPDRAVVVGTGDHHFFGALYLHRALAVRTDVDYVDATLLAHRWYHRRIERRLDVELPYEGRSIDTDRLFSAVLETGRPLFVTHLFHDGLLERWRSSPFVTLVRIHPPGERPPHPMELFRHHLDRLESARMQPRRVPERSWTHYVLDDRAGTWRSIAGALDRIGAQEPAEQAREIADRFDPGGT
jgi:hypothetical protein